MTQAVLEGSDLPEPGLAACLDEALFVVGHLLDSSQLCGVDPEEPAPDARVLVDAGRAVGAMAFAERDGAQQEVVFQLGPFVAFGDAVLAVRSGASLPRR